MSFFDAQDFVELNPDEVRVKVTLPEGFYLNAETSWLGIDITSPAGEHHGVFKVSCCGHVGKTMQSRVFLPTTTANDRRE